MPSPAATNIDFFLIPSILKPFFSYKFFAVLLQHSTVSSKRTILFVLAHKSKLLKKVVPIPFPLYFFKIPITIYAV